MDEKLLIDIGSSTVKVYKQTSEGVSLLLARSIPFKADFDSEKGIAEPAKKELFDLIIEVKEKNELPNSRVSMILNQVYHLRR